MDIFINAMRCLAHESSTCRGQAWDVRQVGYPSPTRWCCRSPHHEPVHSHPADLSVIKMSWEQLPLTVTQSQSIALFR
jgi:hypothetical protein